MRSIRAKSFANPTCPFFVHPVFTHGNAEWQPWSHKLICTRWRSRHCPFRGCCLKLQKAGDVQLNGALLGLHLCLADKTVPRTRHIAWSGTCKKLTANLSSRTLPSSKTFVNCGTILQRMQPRKALPAGTFQTRRPHKGPKVMTDIRIPREIYTPTGASPLL